MKSINLSLCLLFVVTTTALEFPPEITLCKKSDVDCMKKAFKDTITYFAEGSKEYGVPKLEPFTIKEIRIKGNGGAIDLEQIYHNAKIVGPTSLIANDIKITEKGSELVFEVKAYTSKIAMIATYEAKGKMLLFQINGGGSSNMTLENVNGIFRIDCEIIDKGGEKYLHVKNFDLTLVSPHLILDYKNLVNGNAELSQTVLDTMNANSADVFNYLKKDYETLVGAAFRTIASGVLSNIPLNKLFMD